MADDNNEAKRRRIENEDDGEKINAPKVDIAMSITVKKRQAEGIKWLYLAYRDGEWVYSCSECQEKFSRQRVDLSRLLKHQRDSKRHQRAVSMTNLATSFLQQSSRQSFHEDVTAHLLSNNIPLSRVDNLFPPEFVSSIVLRKEMSLLSSCSYRVTYSTPSYQRWRTILIANLLQDVPFSLLVDESSKNNRKVINTIAVTEATRLLIHTGVFEGDESINTDSVCKYIKDVMEDCSLSPAFLTVLRAITHLTWVQR